MRMLWKTGSIAGWMLLTLTWCIVNGLAADTEVQVEWKDGLRLETRDKTVRLRIGGRIHYDWATMSQDSGIQESLGSLQDGTEPRRARLYFSGELHEQVEFKVQYDFAGGTTKFKDIYLGLKGIPVLGKIRLGHMKEPFSLEEMTSSNNVTFLERALPNVFAPSRNTGVLISNDVKERVSWGMGVFLDTNDLGVDQGDGEFNFTGRLTGTPWHAEKGKKVVHLGLGYSHRSPSEPSFRYRQRPEAHLAPRFVDTGSLRMQSAHLVGPEFALVRGPASVQAEYIRAGLNPVTGNANSKFHGYYLLGSYFLTGEQRNYRASSGQFRGIKPRRNFNLGQKGTGAWEVAVRYSSLDLNHGGVSGGKLDDFTAGLNWYLNPNARVMWNYIRANRESLGKADVLQMRFQVNF